MRRAPEIKLSESDRAELAAWSRSRTLPARQVSAARIVLLAAEGQQDIAIAEAVGCARQRCARVRRNYLSGGLERLRREAPRSGRPVEHDAQHIVKLTTTTTPAQATDWSRALMAQASGVSASTVGRVWRRHGLKPHRVGTFKVSRDPHFAEKLKAIVGLYLAPPERALVLCVDEKSQIQAAGPHAAWPAFTGRPAAHTELMADYTRITDKLRRWTAKPSSASSAMPA